MRWFAIFIAVMVGMIVPTASSAGRDTALAPILTNSRSFTIVDDGDRQAAMLVDNVAVDTYVYHPGDMKRITIVTDSGEHRFEFRHGATIDFTIEYRGRRYPQRFAPVEPHRWQGPDVVVLPFELGPNNSILIDATINGSPPLKLLFDTGASVSVLNRGGMDHGATLAGATGEIGLGRLRISNTPIIPIDYGDTLQADGVLGYNVFLGREVAIDYARRELRIGVADDRLPSGYRTAPLLWRGGHSLIMVGLGDGRTSYQVPMVLDTGSKYGVSLSNGNPLAWQTPRLQTFGWRLGSKSDGRRVLSRVFNLPRLSLAGYELTNVQADVERLNGESVLAVDILGNDVLKRFDIILDYKRGRVHLRPNLLAASPYNSVGLSDRKILAACAALFLVSCVILLMFILYRSRRLNEEVRCS